jgi:predicted amidophosphoribosyltransferase
VSVAVPVPLHPWRRLSRGFNQARDLAAQLPLEVAPVLWRVRATKPQEHLTAAARRRNVHGVFAVSPLLTSRQRTRLLEDRVVVLIDDVRTTGATLDQCASALKAAGVREVRAITIAIARPREPRHTQATTWATS